MAQRARRISFELDNFLNARERVSEQEARALEGAEEIGHGLERRALHVLVKDGGRFCEVGASLDLGHLQVRVDLLAYPQELAVSLEVFEGTAQALITHRAGRLFVSMPLGVNASV